MLIGQVLNSLDIGTVVEVQDGHDAARQLEQLRHEPQKVGVSRVDVLISDIVMPGMDGISLLRWVRSSPHSPDRFMPVMMLSAATDRDVVEAARDVGANEFIVKPFTAQGVVSRLLSVIDHPRDFIHCETDFGPDRRRRAAKVSFVDRRKTQESDVRVLCSDIVPPSRCGAEPRIIRFKLANRLKRRLGGMPGRRGNINADLMSAADARIDEGRQDPADSFGAIVDELNEIVARCLDDPGHAPIAYARINEIALDLRGQGDMFGYPLISTCGRSLYEYTRAGYEIDPGHLELVKAHLDLVNVVLRDDVRGDGGTVGRSLLQMLEKAKDKYARRMMKREDTVAI